MKPVFILFSLLLSSITIFAQNNTVQPILDNYLLMKDALVNGDSKQTVVYAKDMQKAIESGGTVKDKEALLKQVGQIVVTTNIEKQRIAFAELSLLMWSMVKDGNKFSQDLYYQYCPMKKAYWISSEVAIKNPYYGSKMLTCGKVEETIKAER